MSDPEQPSTALVVREPLPLQQAEDPRWGAWLSGKRDEAIASRKDAVHFPLALRTVEAMVPVLFRFREVLVTEAGDVPCFLHVSMNDGFVQAALIARNEDGADESPTVERMLSHNDDARDLVAAFLCDFPDAVFMYLDGNKPPRHICLLADRQSSGWSEKRLLTLNNMRDYVARGIVDFGVGCLN